MAEKRSRRLNPDLRDEDKENYTSFVAIKGYKPSNTDYELEKVKTAYETMIEAQKKEIQMEDEYTKAKNAAQNAEWTLHELLMGVKTQVEAQFGENSDEYQSLGRKKKMDYKKPQVRKKPA